jgi:hypothetical protein
VGREYDKICDATQMLFQAEDMTASTGKPSAFKPNTRWNYPQERRIYFQVFYESNSKHIKNI